MEETPLDGSRVLAGFFLLSNGGSSMSSMGDVDVELFLCKLELDIIEPEVVVVGSPDGSPLFVVFFSQNIARRARRARLTIISNTLLPLNRKSAKKNS